MPVHKLRAKFEDFQERKVGHICPARPRNFTLFTRAVLADDF